MGLITPGELSLFFSSACIICLMIDNKIFKGEAWSISLFLVFLVPFYNCMFEILFFLLGILSWMFNIIWVFIFCWDMWLNLLNVTDKSSIYSCSYIAVHVYIRVLCAYLTITFCFRNDIWQLDHLISENHVFICISLTNAKIIASVNYIHIEWKKYSYFATQREATCSKEIFAGENNYLIWYFSLNHKFNQQNH